MARKGIYVNGKEIVARYFGNNKVWEKEVVIARTAVFDGYATLYKSESFLRFSVPRRIATGTYQSVYIKGVEAPSRNITVTDGFSVYVRFENVFQLNNFLRSIYFNSNNNQFSNVSIQLFK